jgi:lipopolysaccharide export system protein LptA
MAWQRPARLAFAAIGIATAVVVYLMLGERRHASHPLTGTQLPPRVVAQSINAQLEHVKGIESQYRVQLARSTAYDDGSTRGEDVTIDAPNHDGRHFIVTARNSYVTKGNSDIELSDSIDLREDDGFFLKTAKATFNQQSGIARADGDVTFGKRRMTGSGTGVTYDHNADVLNITDRARVDFRAEGSQPSVTFRGHSASLDRMQHLLVVAGDVRVTHGEQVITTSMATAHLTETDDRVQFVELRDEARVDGGLGSVASMQAHDMDLKYASDGQTIEHATLRGQGTVTMAPRGGAGGRQLAGESLEIALRPDESLDRINGSGAVSMTMPAAEDTPARTVRGGTIDAKAGPDGALTSARFAGSVTFEESTSGGTRTASSDVLELTMQDEAIASAMFTGHATFADGDLNASARDAQYEPGTGKLHLRQPEQGARPRASNKQVAVSGDLLDIELDGPQITGKGKIASTLTASQSGDSAKGGDADSHLPGLLQQNKPAQVVSDEIKYDGKSGIAQYSGHARLGQDQTDIRAQTIVLQEKSGDLIATGSVTSTIVMDGGVSTGEANELHYIDDTRTITYTAIPRGKPGDAAPLAHVVGSQGDLRARSITVLLGKEESKLERLEGADDVVSKIDAKTVRGNHLTYLASEDSYTVTGIPLAVLNELTDGRCREIQGHTLTFSKAADTMKADGQKKNRAQWTQKPIAACQ